MKTPKVWRQDGTTWFEHECNKGRMIKYTLPTVIWWIVSENPLTIKVRISCSFCGLNGRWEEGVWVPLTDDMVAGRRDG